MIFSMADLNRQGMLRAVAQLHNQLQGERRRRRQAEAACIDLRIRNQDLRCQLAARPSAPPGPASHPGSGPPGWRDLLTVGAEVATIILLLMAVLDWLRR
jgi:hypothetical protein